MSKNKNLNSLSSLDEMISHKIIYNKDYRRKVLENIINELEYYNKTTKLNTELDNYTLHSKSTNTNNILNKSDLPTQKDLLNKRMKGKSILWQIFNLTIGDVLIDGINIVPCYSDYIEIEYTKFIENLNTCLNEIEKYHLNKINLKTSLNMNFGNVLLYDKNILYTNEYLRFKNELLLRKNILLKSNFGKLLLHCI